MREKVLAMKDGSQSLMPSRSMPCNTMAKAIKRKPEPKRKGCSFSSSLFCSVIFSGSFDEAMLHSSIFLQQYDQNEEDRSDDDENGQDGE